MQGTRRKLLAAAIAASTGVPATGRAGREEERRLMLQTIIEHTRVLASEIGRARLSERVLQAMRRVPRDRFVPAALADQAFSDRPLPIGEGQTISQPFIVALMTDLIEPQPHFRVLEVGTGSGYQAAVLAECVAEVYTIEIVESLARRARQVLDDLGYRTVHTRIGDGYAGWPEAAPFHGIVVTAAPDHVPPALVEQLAPGGRLVVPVGPQFGGQDLLLVHKGTDGTTVTRRTLSVRFVPLTGEAQRGRR
jgi:protein-L-isoaspartate(D-aspartate) O-methyltransferase